MGRRVWTVLGPIDSDRLSHFEYEHLFLDMMPIYFQLPEPASQRKFARLPVSLETLGWIRFNPYSNEDNLRLEDEEMMIEEVLSFRDTGGQKIVDVTSVALGRDPEALIRVSLRTGVNLIACRIC